MSAGKGDATRPTNGRKYRRNWDKIFKTKEGRDGKTPRSKPVDNDSSNSADADAPV